jgi:hypothetical protein
MFTAIGTKIMGTGIQIIADFIFFDTGFFVESITVSFFTEITGFADIWNLIIMTAKLITVVESTINRIITINWDKLA